MSGVHLAAALVFGAVALVAGCSSDKPKPAALESITPQIAEQLNLRDTTGVVVLSVSQGGPADDAGIRPGDIITRIEDDELSAPEDLLAALRRRDPGETVAVETRRGTDTRTVDVELTDRPAAQS